MAKSKMSSGKKQAPTPKASVAEDVKLLDAPNKPDTDKEKTPAQLAEMYGYDSPTALPYVPWGAKSFADLQAAEEAQEASEEIRDLSYQFGCLVNNVIGDQTVTDKLAAIQTVIDEFSALVNETLGGVTTPDDAPDETIDAAEFAESAAGHVVSLVEANGGASRGVLRMNVVLIKPGFGNRRDNHYYPESILRRDAKIFEGVKMYTSDHRDDEKSERTEVSKIEKIVGFTDEGAPIARVAVFDPDFAEKARNRADAGMLDSLECSILASGRAKRGTIDGKPNVNIVEVITAAKSVDWVTKAGAGGRAISLAESDIQPEEETMTKKTKPDETEVETPATETTTAESQPVAIAEAEVPAATAPIELSEAEVVTALATTRLPALAQKKLAARKYADSEMLKEAVDGEIAYLKEITGSGRPFQPESTKPQAAARPLAEVNKTLDAINKKYLRG